MRSKFKSLKFKRRICFVVIVLLAGGLQSACFLKFWGKDNPEEKIYNVKGQVQSMTRTELVIQTGKGTEEFVLTDASIRGQADEYDPGTPVHVYYKIRDNIREVTMVVEIVG